MAESPHGSHHPHFSAESSDLSERTLSSASTHVPSIFSSVHNRPGYERIVSDQEEDISYRGAIEQQDEGPENDSVHGLCIQFSEHDEDRLTFGATVSSKSSPNTPGSADSLLSPKSAWSIRRGSRGWDDSPETDDHSTYNPSPSSFYRPFTADSDHISLRRERAPATGSHATPGRPIEPICRTKRHFHQGRGSWLSITILILSVYSTIFSGIWLGLAIAKPRYRKYVSDHGLLTPSTASLLCTAFARTIELSFVTVFVTFLGQVLSHRAFVKSSKGITIAEMQMRVWIQQPGSLITHWETVRYAAFSFLGAMALTAAFIAMLYTTASDALVAPKLKFGSLEKQVLYAEVKTIFGNNTYQIDHCNSPVTDAMDPWNAGHTCMAIEHSGQAYHNYIQYLTSWSEAIRVKNGSTKLSERPPPVGMLFDNTTIQGSWIQVADMPAVSKKFDRVINNVTVAMPLSAVFGAARNPINNILQPQDLNVHLNYPLD